MKNIKVLKGVNIYTLITKLQDSRKLNLNQASQVRRVLNSNRPTTAERNYIKNLYLTIFECKSKAVVERNRERIVQQHELINYQFGA